MIDQEIKSDTGLFNNNKNILPEKEAEMLMEQYKLYVEMMNSNSGRRYQTNSFFLSLNTILITILTGFISITQNYSIHYGWMIISALSGIVISMIWRNLIISYRQLSRGKFIVISQLETHLPANPFDIEWKTLRHGDGTIYKPFSNLELSIPIVFIVLYSIMIVFSLVDIFIWAVLYNSTS